MDNIFESLNSKQAEAVRATEGRVRIVAGAGSGKTRVLAHRYAYIVNELGIDPEATEEAFSGEWFRTGDYGTRKRLRMHHTRVLRQSASA